MRILWGFIALLGASLGIMPVAAAGGGLTYHYSYADGGLIRDYLMPSQEIFPLGITDTTNVYSLAVDPTGSYVVFCYSDYTEGDEPPLHVIMRDIVNGFNLWEYNYTSKSCGLGVGAFNEGGDLFAMSLLNFYPDSMMPMAAGPWGFSYGLYNAFDGILVNQLDLNYVPFDTIPTPGLNMIYNLYTIRNEADNIVFNAIPFSYDGGFFAGEVYRWDAAFNVVADNYSYGLPSAYWLLNDEVIYPDFEATLPAATLIGPYLQDNNVVRVSRYGSTEVIFYTPIYTILQIEPIEQDGVRVYMILNPDTESMEYEYGYQNVFRDGTVTAVQPISSPPSLVWMAPSIAYANYTAFTPANPFSAEAAPETVIEDGDPFQCAGFLPSRLVAGAAARITPGDPNILRNNPAVTATKIGTIPGSAYFNVMSGPVCDPAGIAWWQINYNGLIGWTAEGKGSVYYTEPLP